MRYHQTWDEAHQVRKRELALSRMWAGFPGFVEFWLDQTLPAYQTPGARWRDASAVLDSFRYDPTRARDYLNAASASEDLASWLWYADGTGREETMTRVNIGFMLLLPSLLGRAPEDPETVWWARTFQPKLSKGSGPHGGIPDVDAWAYPIPLERIPAFGKTGVSVAVLKRFISKDSDVYPVEIALGFAEGQFPLEYALALLDSETGYA